MTMEKRVKAFNGWLVVLTQFVVVLLLVWMIARIVSAQEQAWQAIVGISLLFFLFVFIFFGYFVLQPNEATVLILFGKCKGTVREDGFFWTNSFKLANPRSYYTVSLRIRNFEVEKLKVNDKRGNPIEIGAVVVWRVQDKLRHFLMLTVTCSLLVKIQSDAALRHLASSYPYDHGEDENEIALRSDIDEVSLHLKKELQERLDRAGVLVEEARLTHLAYAPEIASAMLRRQQAEAIIAARKKIVQGAVSMVEMALESLLEKKVIELDEERKAVMVSNLLVVLCGEAEATPVINTGTLYK